jgi:hypothetical protein
VNSLAYCAQEVLTAAEEMKEAAVGTNRSEDAASRATGFEPAIVAAFLRRNAALLDVAKLPERSGISPNAVARETAQTLQQLATQLETTRTRMEDLERHLTMLEEKLFSILLAAASDEEVLSVRAQADRELAPYRSKMPTAQIGQLQKQYTYKRLLERYNLPRLSLFYI